MGFIVDPGQLRHIDVGITLGRRKGRMSKELPNVIEGPPVYHEVGSECVPQVVNPTVANPRQLASTLEFTPEIEPRYGEHPFFIAVE